MNKTTHIAMALALAAVLGAALLYYAAPNLAGSAAPMAQPPAMMVPAQMIASPMPVFGFAGTKCPTGSELYKGPENESVAAEGVVYCAFVKQYNAVRKDMFNGKCPGEVKPYESTTFKSDPDTIWCELPKAPKPLGLGKVTRRPPPPEPKAATTAPVQ